MEGMDIQRVTIWKEWIYKELLYGMDNILAISNEFSFLF